MNKLSIGQAAPPSPPPPPPPPLTLDIDVSPSQDKKSILVTAKTGMLAVQFAMPPDWGAPLADNLVKVQTMLDPPNPAAQPEAPPSPPKAKRARPKKKGRKRGGS